MPLFTYKAKNINRHEIKGEIEAASKKDALFRLKKRNLSVVFIEEKQLNFLTKDIEIKWFSRVRNQDLLFFLRQLSSMIKSGAKIVESLNIIILNTKNKHLKKALILMVEDIQDGKTLHHAFMRNDKIFPKLTIEMISVGEKTGRLASVIDNLVTYYEKRSKLYSGISNALIYPTFLLIMIFIVMSVLMVYVIPSYIKIFEGSDASLPKVTEITIAVSNFFSNNIILIGLSILALIFTSIAVYKNENGKKVIDSIILKVPFFGNVARYNNYYIMFSTLNSLLESSILQLDALIITKDVVSNNVYKTILKNSIEHIEQGEKLSDSMFDHWAIHPYIPYMLSVGERSSDISTISGDLAQYFETNLNYKLERFKIMIEPVLILFMAFVVGFIIVSILLPMYSIMDINNF